MKNIKVGSGITEYEITRFDTPRENDEALKNAIRDLSAKWDQAGNAFELIISTDEQWAQAIAAGTVQTLKKADASAEIKRLAERMLRYINLARTDIQKGNAADAARWARMAGYISAQIDIKLEWEEKALSGERLSKTNSIKGKKGRESQQGGAEFGKALNVIYSRLAERKDALGDYELPGELWGRFYAELDEAHMNPNEYEKAGEKLYSLTGGKKITFEAFRKKLQRLRKQP